MRVHMAQVLPVWRARLESAERQAVQVLPPRNGADARTVHYPCMVCSVHTRLFQQTSEIVTLQLQSETSREAGTHERAWLAHPPLPRSFSPLPFTDLEEVMQEEKRYGAARFSIFVTRVWTSQVVKTGNNTISGTYCECSRVPPPSDAQ